jgi:lipopolysaccharide cholinephosphotransferase
MGANYFKPKELSTLVQTKFEDMEVYIPKGYDSYLRRRYGNYMQPPSLEEQRGHHGMDLPDPFTPCNHSEILYWENRRQRNLAKI